ncbi:hypothetical protein [Staphylococcus petrasii]|uniref:hypothetical protein n=1 Tax=Staphylococcus petrasii TaxID=1276936 RepID=UPI001F58E816|nr:hypothetical protein [Staphylococcus petrasii]MCI2773436.1 hypothetical protein [Staphylococcus petrasii]
MAKLEVKFQIEGTAYIDAVEESEREEMRVMELAEKAPYEYLNDMEVDYTSINSQGWKW